MGSGKSTLGRLVSKATGIPFIDLDAYIENRFHKSIRDLFAERGEEGFRIIERSMLHEVADMEDVIVACGGGTPCYFDNMEHINSRGVTVWLQAPLSILHSRLMRGRHKRPLIANLDSEGLRDFIVKALEQRRRHYSQSLHSFDTALLENETDREHTAQRFISQFINDGTITRI